MKRTSAILALAVLALVVPSCKRANKEKLEPPAAAAPTPAPSNQQVAVTSVTLGNGVGTDKRVTAAGDTFAPTDTIYASVDTEGTAPQASLSARWTFEDGQTVHEETQALTLTGPATTEFHISKPDGWPKGGYKVEIMVDGVPVKSASFRVG